MTRLKLIINLFFIILSVPLAYFVLLSHWGVQQEEKAELQYFTKLLFDTIEQDLNALVFREEIRAVDEYSYYLAADAVVPETASRRSPLSYPPEEPYILGYLQNNPDGSLQTPLVETLTPVPQEQRATIERLTAVNTLFNTASFRASEEQIDTGTHGSAKTSQQEMVSLFDQRYLNWSKLQEFTDRTISKDAPVQRITRDQLYNIVQQEAPNVRDKAMIPAEFEVEHVQVKVTPMQSRVMNAQDILMFRHIEINSQVYRQGFVILVEEFLRYLQDTYFNGQPMTAFTQLRLEIIEQDNTIYATETGEIPKKPAAAFHRVFPQPFSFLRMTLFCEKFPPSGGRRLLNIMRILTGAIILIGLLTMYQSARTVMELSERRAQFVSSVTHELKTPLTNIQMYSEMLEQGVARNREREEEYFQIIGAESRRLSRLIEQVLEFSKLERKQRRFHLQEGTFDDVLSEAQQILQESLDRNDFVLKVEKAASLRFRYDRDVMIQILVNVLGNSIKFGKNAPPREITISVIPEGSHIRISVSDTGPGIPEKDLKKVFDDFYRSDHEISRATRGTGIGLALVKKYVTALGGSIRASNNEGAGCTISMQLPA